MLHPVGGRVKLKREFVDLDPIPDRDRRIHHPGQRNVRQTQIHFLHSCRRYRSDCRRWRGKQRNIADPNAPPHDSVYDRFALPGVIQYDTERPHRPEGLRLHARLANYDKTIPVPPEEPGVLGLSRAFS